MIKLVASPRALPERWRAFIQTTHCQHFGYEIGFIIENHWWFADVRQGVIRGVGGAIKESETELFLGPCVVLPDFRGQGIQRKLIKIRENLGREEGFFKAVSRTRYKNYISSNNLIRCGFLISDPWHSRFNHGGSFIYWSKKLANRIS